MKTETLNYTVHIEAAEEGGYWAQVPALPGCFSQGETYEETVQNTKEAIELYIEGLIEEKKEVPREKMSSTVSLDVNVPVNN